MSAATAVIDPICHYVVIRRDLSLGLMCAQIVHAAGESAGSDLPSDTHAVVLSVPDEQRLREIAARFVKAGIPHRLICEPDEPWAGQAMALGIFPARKSAMRKLVSDLPLLREVPAK